MTCEGCFQSSRPEREAQKDVKNSGNELKNLLKTKNITLCKVRKRTENELVFACKKEQIGSNKDQNMAREERLASQAEGADLKFKQVFQTAV